MNLKEYTKEEWRDVCRKLAPKWDDDRFEIEWELYQKWKSFKKLNS